jgi:DNA helicase HerA-like ATPase
MLGIEPVFEQFPATVWDVFGKQGHPLRATVSAMGPLLIARLLQLNETQAGVLAIAFKYANDNELILIDLKDLQSLMQYVGENADQLTLSYGNVSAASVGAIQRGLLQIDEQGGDFFFGEPAVKLDDFMMASPTGKGVLNLLAADQLVQAPKLYSTFLLWLLSELFESLPEAGDLDKPKLVFFFDEAHLLFTDAPQALIDKVELVVRLIRSKGVGVYFVTQNPADIPDKVLAQLGNRVQHALRAYTPQEQKGVKAAATSFRVNPKLDTETVITELGVGEVLISTLDEKGVPTIVDRAFVVPPVGHIGPITLEQRQQLITNSPVAGKYENRIDNVSTFEKLKAQSDEKLAGQQREAEEAAIAKQDEEAAKAEERATHKAKGSEESVAGDVLKYAKTAHGTRTIKSVLSFVWGLISKKNK